MSVVNYSLIAALYADLQVYIASIQIKRKLKNGTISIKPKPIFPGCVFLKCVMNKDVHDFIRECDGLEGLLDQRLEIRKASYFFIILLFLASIKRIVYAFSAANYYKAVFFLFYPK